MTRAALSVAMLAGLMLTACAPSIEEIERDFDAALAEANSCSEATECVVIYPGCPFGCFVAVHRDHEAEIKQLAEDLIAASQRGGQACAYSCLGAGDPTCVDNHCQVEAGE